MSSAEDLIKIGINFPVSAPALPVCRTINTRLNAIGAGPIVFADPRTSQPHVTIALGTIKTSDIPALVSRTENRVAEIREPCEMKFGTIWREQLTGRYIVADVELDPEISRWRSRTRDILADYFVFKSKMTDVAHLTLGIAEEQYDEIDRLIPELPSIPACLVDRVHVSRSGEGGVKTEVLAEVRFAER